MWVVSRLARKRGMGKCQGDCGIPQPSLQSEDMPQKPLDISTPLFYPRAEEQQESLPGEQLRDADAARIHKSVRVCSHMVHHKIPRKKLRGIFLLLFFKKAVISVHHRGREQPGSGGTSRRTKTVQWTVFRARESPRGVWRKLQICGGCAFTDCCFWGENGLVHHRGRERLAWT